MFPIKGNIGHTVGASGGIEAVVAVSVLTTGLVPPVPTTEHALEEVRRFLPPRSEPKSVECDVVLSNNMGFGDQNVSILIRGPRLRMG